MLASTNEALLRNGNERFCSVALLRLHRNRVGPDPDSWTATVSSGGHPLPVLTQPGGPMLDVCQPGPLLGVFDDAQFLDDDIRLEPGHALVLFTDGVTEARRNSDWFGDEGLASTIATSGSSSATGLVDGILSAVLAFQGGFPSDDIALVAIRMPEPGGGGNSNSPSLRPVVD